MINNNKTIATAVLAVVMTVTALALASPQSSWDGALLTDSGYDSSAATTAAIPNMPDVWSAFDAVSDVMSFEWLIPSAFAAPPTVTDVNGNLPYDVEYGYFNVTSTEEIPVIISINAMCDGSCMYDWFPSSSELDSNINDFNTSIVTLTPPSVNATSTFVIGVYIDQANNDENTLIYISLIVRDVGNATNTPPTIDPSGPLSVALESSVSPNPMVNDPDGSANHVYTWTASPTGIVTLTDIDRLRPTITAPANDTVTEVTLTLTIVDGEHTVDSQITLNIFDPNTNVAPTIDPSGPLSVALESSVSPNPMVNDPDGSANHVYTWTASPTGIVTLTDIDRLRPTITAPANDTVTEVTLTLTIVDGEHTVDSQITLNIFDPNTNVAPTIDPSGPLSVALESSVSPNPMVNDPDGTANHVYTWTASPTGIVTLTDIDRLRPTITAPANDTVTEVTLTLTIVDGEHTVDSQITLNIFDPNTNVAPTIDNISGAMAVKERTSVTLTATASDPNTDDTLTYMWDDSALPTGTVATGNTAKSLKFTAPGISSSTQPFAFTLTVTDQRGLFATSTVTVMVEDVPLKVSSVTYNPGNGQLRITFNQNIESSPSYGSIHVRSADSSSDGISLSDIDVKSFDRAVITATLSTEQKETYADLQNPQIDIDSGAVSDVDGASIVATPDTVITTISKKKSSSSSSAPIVDLNRLVQARIVDIPSVISEQVSSHNAADPLEPILDNNTFDFPLTINNYSYLLDSTTNTLTPRAVTTGQSAEIEFTVYTDEDLAHFTLYLNLQGDDTRYAYSDTYITYTDDGTVTVTDPNEYIADATITVTQEDSSMPEKKTVTITIVFDEPMGLTNMVAYMWNTDRKATIINLIDAIDVTADAETRQNNASTADSSTSARVNPEPDVSDDNRSDGGGSQSGINSGIAVIGGDNDDDDVQTLSLIRMWSGFASESITDAELLKSMGLDNYPVVHIPNWVMTELGALVSNNDVTVKEFRTALVYMLEMLTA